MSSFSSTFDGGMQDRVWLAGCTNSLPAGQQDAWTDYVNIFNADIDFQCGSNRIVTGLIGDYESQHKDRRYKFLCSAVPGMTTSNCYLTPF